VGTILCIDDHTYAMAARIAWLRALGYNVIVAGSIQAALDSLLTNPIQAAVLDCHMPDACLAAGVLKRIRPGLPVIMLASYCGVPCQQPDVVTACLGKGEPPVTLLHTLRKVMTGEAPGQTAA
jgi:CheY-like chemotaxis protein